VEDALSNFARRRSRRKKGAPGRPDVEFLKLVPVEYGGGVSGTQVTQDFEIRKPQTFHSGHWQH
jgi:hypothetical protein